MKPRQTEAQIARALARLDQVRDAVPALAGLGAVEVLRAMDDRAVFSAELDGAGVIVKLILTGDAERVAAIAARQADRFAALPEGFSIAEPLLAVPDQGVLVSRRIEGMDFARAIRGADAAGAEALCEAAGRWLSHFTDGTVTPGPIFHRQLMKRTEKACEKLEGADAALGREAVARLHQIAGRLGHTPSPAGLIHGDFAPMNLMRAADGRVLGIDVESTARLFAMVDVAKFLTLANHYQPVEDAQFLGLSGRYVDAFERGWGGFSDADRSLILPFFIGRALVEHFCALGQAAEVKAARRAALDRFLKATA